VISDFSLVNALVTIGFGALAGGLTNAVAIWMLFHPYEPRGPRGLKLQGAIPKNKPRLAKTIGRTVGQRLLTADDITQQLTAPGLREAFDRAVHGFVSAALATERGSLKDELPGNILDELRSIFGLIAPVISDRLASFAETDTFREGALALHQRLTSELQDRPIADILTDERRESLRTRVESWVADAVMSPELESVIGGWIDRQVARFEHDDMPLLDRLPPALVAAVEREIAGYLPLAMDRIAAALSDPNARKKIQESLHKLFDGFVKSLLLHERIVARLVVTEKTITRLLDNVERDGTEQVARLLAEPEMRDQVARSVNDAVVKFLRQPLSEHLRTLGADRVRGIKDTVNAHVIAALQDAATRAYAIERVDEAVAEGVKGRTVGDVLRYIPAEDIVEWARAALKNPRVREWVEEGAAGVFNKLLDRPIGRPADHLPDTSVDRISAALAPVIWNWMRDQIPIVVERVDIQRMVEEKVLGFSLERIEQIVRNTTQRELDVIIKLGYALGAVVGAIAYAVSVALP
jgi:uncharacterized membrane protein YheB (UPF0754 family)